MQKIQKTALKLNLKTKNKKQKIKILCVYIFDYNIIKRTVFLCPKLKGFDNVYTEKKSSY